VRKGRPHDAIIPPVTARTPDEISMTKILFLGSHVRSTQCLQYLAEHAPEAEVTGLVLNRSHSGDYDHGPIKSIAYKHNIPLLALESVTSVRYDLGICVMFDRILASEVVDQPPRGFINLHLGPLPRFRGVHSVFHAIHRARRDNNWMFGITLHYMDHGLDTGPIIDKIDIPFSEDDTAYALYSRASGKLFELFLRNIGPLLASTKCVRSTPQCGLSYCFKRSDMNLEVDLRASPDEIYDTVRALTFPGKPGAYARIGDRKIYLSLADSNSSDQCA
jgi:methionyl-tRNA formyltransferase